MKLANTVFLIASQTRAFWKVRAYSGRLRFYGHRRLFQFRSRLQENRIQTGTIFSLTRITLWPVIFAIALAAIMQLIDPLFHDMYDRTGLKITADIYGTLLGTVTGIGAVLIGLYYAATTAIGGAIYARVPNNIRDLLARDRVGNIYMRQLAFLTYLGVILLAFRAAGFAPVRIAIPFIIIASGIAIRAFVILGARAFNLFDPTTLTSDLFEQIERSYLQMTAGVYRWLDPSFQRHVHRVSQSAIDTLGTLAKITATEPHLSAQPYLVLCQQALLFLVRYEPNKKRIPTESLWYAQRHTHPDWYQSPDSETSLAHQASAALTPKSASDPRWVERFVLPIVYDCINRNVLAGRFDIVLELLNYMDVYVRALSAEHQVQTALQTLNELTTACGPSLFAPLKADETIESLERLAIADQLASMPINVFLSYLDAAKEVSREAIISKVRTINWRSKKGIYVTGLPVHLLAPLEWIRPRIDFEYRSEGTRVSPDWYIDELIIKPAAENAQSSTTGLLTDIVSLYDKWAKAAKDSNIIWVEATILSRENEYWSKVDYQFWRLRERWSDLNSARLIEGLPWPMLDLDELDRARRRRRKHLRALMSAKSAALTQSPRPDSYPDFGGKFLHVSAESLFESMFENDSAAVNEIFPALFHSSLLQFNRILTNTDYASWRADVRVKVAVAPVLDLLDLSGYSILFAEYHANPAISGLVVRLWNAYLDDSINTEGGISRAAFLANAISISEGALELAHRSLIRMHWKQEVESLLRQLDRRHISIRSSGYPGLSRSVAVHDSPLVRVFARGDLGSFHDGIDIFILRILRQRDDGKDLEYSHMRRELGEELAREEKRGSKDEDGEEDDGDG